MKYFVRVVLALVCTMSLSHAQDSLQFFGHGTLRITGGLYYLSHQGDDSKIVLPDFQEEMWKSTTILGNVVERDNPLLHGASYIDIDGNFEVMPGFTVHANLVAEHRGFSYGVYPRDMMVVYPKIRFAADTAVHVFGERFDLHASAGNVTDGRPYEGLLFYNMDWQGTIFSVKWDHFKLQYHKIGDLEYGVGLGLNDADDFMLMAEALPVGAGWHTDIKLGSYFHPSTGYEGVSGFWSSNTTSGFGTTASIAVYPSDHYRVYAQAALRGKRAEYESSGDFTAFVAGASARTEWGDLSFTARAEYRHYGAEFNRRFNSIRPDEKRYREDHLYPISLYPRPFSQWAVFTDYIARDVDGASLYFEGIYRLPYHVILYGMADLNYLMPGESLNPDEGTLEDFLWAFYEAGIGWSPAYNIMLRYTYGNKGMNIDRHYPTFYMYRDPVMKLTAEYGFDVAKW